MKKFIVLLLVLVLTLSLACSLVACGDKASSGSDNGGSSTGGGGTGGEGGGTGGGGTDQKVITYLGDSICEALIGASPLSERDNYGYYALVGRMNGFRYYNHSVSGHQTSDGMLKDGYGLLELISNTYEDAVLIQSHIKEADMIHISILGNNALQFDLGLLMMEAASPTFEDDFENGTSLLYHMIHGIEDVDPEEYTRLSLTTGEDYVFNFPNTYQNICDIVSKLKELNPNAKIIFQKVYNPVFEGTTLLKKEYKDALAEIVDDGRFGNEGSYITEWSQLRAVAQTILDILNGVLDTYNEEHPGEIEILDINQYFTEITDGDYSTDSAGAQLMYADWTHPSNKGHAAIAAKTQEWVESLGYASPNALKNYKEIKIEQINRMYKGQQGFDADAAINAINIANSITDVSAAYFNATDAFAPDYSRENLEYDRTGEKYYSKTTKFAIAEYAQGEPGLQVAGMGGTIVSAIEGLAFNMDECYAEFTTDGKLHFQLQTADGLLGTVGDLLDLVNIDMTELEAGLASFDLGGAVDQFVAQLFPGFEIATLEESLNRIGTSIGVNITGLDYENQEIQDLIASIATNQKLPGDLLDQLTDIQSDLVLTLTMDVDYRIKTVKSVSGEEFTAIYLGKEVAVNPDTQPIGIFTETTLADGRKHLVLSIDFIGLYLPLVEIVE